EVSRAQPSCRSPDRDRRRWTDGTAVGTVSFDVAGGPADDQGRAGGDRSVCQRRVRTIDGREAGADLVPHRSTWRQATRNAATSGRIMIRFGGEETIGLTEIGWRPRAERTDYVNPETSWFVIQGGHDGSRW